MRNQRALFHHIGPSRKQEPIGENLTDRTFARARLRNKETGVQLLVNSNLPEGSLLHVTSVYREQYGVMMKVRLQEEMRSQH